MRRHRQAGRSALAVYREGRHAYRREILRPLLFATTPLLLLGAVIRLYFPWDPNFVAGLWLGSVLAMSNAVWAEIPEAIENWRRGAAGEWLTEKALAGLGHLRHDATLGFGNVDHILVNDRGVFIVDSKAPRGVTTIGPESVVAQNAWISLSKWDIQRSTGGSARGNAVTLRKHIASELGLTLEVNAFVAIWCEVDGEPQKINRVTYLNGADLSAHIASFPPLMNDAEQRSLIELVEALPAADRPDHWIVAGLKRVFAPTRVPISASDQ